MIDADNPSVVRKAKELIDYWLKDKPKAEDEKLSRVEALLKVDSLNDAADIMPDFKNSARCWYLKALLSYKRVELVRASYYASKCLELNGTLKAYQLAQKANKLLAYLKDASQLMKKQSYKRANLLLTEALKIDKGNLRAKQVIHFQRALVRHKAGSELKALKDYYMFEQLQLKTGWIVMKDGYKN